MISIKVANINDAEVLALLARATYSESHGHFINNDEDLQNYLNNAFSMSKIKEELNNPKNIFYISYANELPVGYGKLVLDELHKSINLKNTVRLERIYVLEDYIPLKIGKLLMDFAEEKVKELNYKSIWLSVYVKNYRAINFYKKNGFVKTGELNFMVNGKVFDNDVLLKEF